MPLYKGRKNVGRNIRTELARGKPLRVARAIALRAAGVPRKKRVRKVGR